MSKKSSIIELNGKRYDAITGRLIGAVKKVARPAAASSIDGFTKAKALTSRITAKSHPERPAQTVHRRAQKGKTLMRKAVNKPVPPSGFRRLITSNNLDQNGPGRLSRATEVLKSSRVSHYYSPIHSSELKTVKKPSSPNQVVIPAPSSQNSGGLALSRPLPSMVTSVSHQHLERILDEALAKADAHKQMLKQLHKRNFLHKLGVPKWLSMGIVALLALTAVGLFIWQRVPQVSIKLAANKANISASLPAYKPAGFSVKGPVKYQGGAVIMNYGASGKQGYTVSQQASAEDSLSLAANSIPTNIPVQTTQVKGTTVYIYGSSNDAAWVSNGIRYTIKDHANLSSDQIIKIADSL